MTMMQNPIINQRRAAVSKILATSADNLDIPEDVLREADERYEDLATFIKEENEQRDHVSSELYPQGSRRLGTLIRPITDIDEYDFDLVYKRDIEETSTTQEQLKKHAGDQLRRYVRHKQRTGSDVPRLTEGRRCWTLTYDLRARDGARSHMDVLPAIPDPDGLPHSILITDQELRHWQHSDPKGYAAWFFERMTVTWEEARMLVAKATGVDVEDVPDWRVKTPLQRAVQILKRHRDKRFDGHPDDKPISIIITTLAAQSYENEADLYTAMLNIVRGMRDHIELRDGVFWVPNPVNDEENFADKWKEHPERAHEFFKWLDQVETDLDAIINKRGLDEVSGVLAQRLGTTTTTKALTSIGHATREQRMAGNLTAAAITGALGSTGAVPVRPHTFFGDVETR